MLPPVISRSANLVYGVLKLGEERGEKHMKYAATSALALGCALAAMGCTTTAQTSNEPATRHYGDGYRGSNSQLVLFDGEDYYGVARVIEGPEPSLDYLNFNDRAASLDIRGSGAGWLVCRDINFEGPCLVVRESVDDLDELGLGDRISSVRPASPRNPYPHGTLFGLNRYGDVVFYEADFFGNLSEMDPYDAWGYSAYDYGYADTYRTGRYGDYGRYGRYNPYNPYDDYGYDAGRDWNGYRGPNNADIVLYRDINYSGPAYGLNQNAWDLSSLYFNDEVSSIEIRRGKWEICTDSNFRGRCEIIDANTYSLDLLTLNDMISSVRRVGYGHGGRGHDRDHDRDHEGHHGRDHDREGHGRGNQGDIVLFEHGNYQGRSVGVSTDIPNVGTLGLNDRISSVQIRSGTWEVCENSNFGGRCQIVSASSGDLGAVRMNDNISSIRRVSAGDRNHNDDRGNRGRERDRDHDRGHDDRERDRNQQRDGDRNRSNQGLVGGPEDNVTGLPPGIRAVRQQQGVENARDREAEQARDREAERQRIEQLRAQAERERVDAEEIRRRAAERQGVQDAQAAVQQREAEQRRIESRRQQLEAQRENEVRAQQEAARQAETRRQQMIAQQQERERAIREQAAREAEARREEMTRVAPKPQPEPVGPRRNESKQEMLIRRNQERK